VSDPPDTSLQSIQTHTHSFELEAEAHDNALLAT